MRGEAKAARSDKSMRLREPKIRRGLRGKEMLDSAESEHSFDIVQHVPPEFWDERRIVEQALTGDSSIHSNLENIIRMAQLNPDLAKRLRSYPEVRALVERQAKIKWDLAVGGSDDHPNTNPGSLRDLASFLNVFPELRTVHTLVTENQFNALLERTLQIAEHGTEYELHLPIYLLQVLPERVDRIREALDQPEFKAKFDQKLEEILHRPRLSPDIRYMALASAALLYPQDAAIYKSQAKSDWSTILDKLENVKDGGNAMAGGTVWDAAVLNAPQPHIDDKGKLVIRDNPPVEKRRPLPERVVA